MTKLLYVCCTSLVLSCVISGEAWSQSDPYARDLTRLTQWFEGEFDNDSQIWLENRRDWEGNPEEKHNRLHITHVPVDAPSIGEHVFYVEEFMDNDPEKIVRQRVVNFLSDKGAGGIRMQIYFLKEAKKFIGAQHNQELLQTITMNDLLGIDGCDVIFQRKGEQYHGGMLDKACQFGEGDLKRYSVHDMIISKNQYWRVDRTFLVKNDQFHKGHPNDIPHKMRKAAFYSCDVAFHEVAYYMPSEKDKRYKAVKVHNQGGMQWLYNPIKDKKYGVQIREKEYPFYAEGSDFLMLRFIEEGKMASEVIVTVSPGTQNLSFQIGWASANCKLIE